MSFLEYDLKKDPSYIKITKLCLCNNKFQKKTKTKCHLGKNGKDVLASKFSSKSPITTENCYCTQNPRREREK
jgi:hypothetical protein